MPVVTSTWRRDDRLTAALADSALVVHRLARDSGLPPGLADDVTFVTMQQACPLSGELAEFGPAWLLRTALEQSAIARCLASRRRRRGARSRDVNSVHR